MSRTKNPYKEGTFNFSIWQAAYLAGRIDGAHEVTMAHLNLVRKKEKKGGDKE